MPTLGNWRRELSRLRMRGTAAVVNTVVLLVGPSGVGKSTIYPLAAPHFPDRAFHHLDGLASRWAMMHGWIERESVSLLRETLNQDELFLAVGLQAIADFARRENRGQVVDVGAGFQMASYARRLPILYTCVAIMAESRIAFNRIKGRGYSESYDQYCRDEFGAARQKLYERSQRRIDTTYLSPEQAAKNLVAILHTLL
jgi:ribose 1,5-bisphosphokinase PhnN